MSKKKVKEKKPKEPEYRKALKRLNDSVLRGVERETGVCCDDSYPMAKNDWAYVTSEGRLYLNPNREAPAAEWEYVIAHCLLHLGMGHVQQERLGDPAWLCACDLVVTRFLRDSRIGRAPYEFLAELPISAKGEEQAYEQLRPLPPERWGASFSTMTNGRPDMIWTGKSEVDYEQLLADSFLDAMRNSVREAAGLEPEDDERTWQGLYPCKLARDWFISSYPLLGAVAADFRFIVDKAVARRLDIEIAAVSPQMKEIYINPIARLTQEEWKFVLAHEFLHAALRHDARCEDREPTLWNVACDFVINAWLLEMGVGEMPECVLYEERFKDMPAETVYDMVCQNIRYYKGICPDDLIYGDGDWWVTLDGAQVDAFYRSALQQGLEYHRSKCRGDLPGNLIEEIYALSRPPIHWDVELAKWFDEQFEPIEKQRTYARMNRRQSATPDIPRPAWRMEEEAVEQRIFGVLLDTSGSMERSLLAVALGTIASYAEARDVHNVRVVFCDAAAYDQGVMCPEDIAGAVKIRGRGGTVLQPGIDLLDADEKFPKDAPLLIITDGYCDRLTLHNRKHAYLVPWGNRLPFPPKGPVFRMK